MTEITFAWWQAAILLYFIFFTGFTGFTITRN
jgi:hypothetical protein